MKTIRGYTITILTNNEIIGLEEKQALYMIMKSIIFALERKRMKNACILEVVVKY